MLSMFINILQGPCAGNQLALAHSRLWDAVSGFLFIFAHMQDKLSKVCTGVPWFHCSSHYLTTAFLGHVAVLLVVCSGIGHWLYMYFTHIIPYLIIVKDLLCFLACLTSCFHHVFLPI